MVKVVGATKDLVVVNLEADNDQGIQLDKEKLFRTLLGSSKIISKSI